MFPWYWLLVPWYADWLLVPWYWVLVPWYADWLLVPWYADWLLADWWVGSALLSLLTSHVLSFFTLTFPSLSLLIPLPSIFETNKELKVRLQKELKVCLQKELKVSTERAQTKTPVLQDKSDRPCPGQVITACAVMHNICIGAGDIMAPDADIVEDVAMRGGCVGGGQWCPLAGPTVCRGVCPGGGSHGPPIYIRYVKQL
ncbi:hypothetical protein F7725_027098 [Dissostichus mawsoni]|uniref:Uncharacterized protein n=1 Tax=Dissostichus mawsoni TaxID=36200 RepID=A0A7J5XC10_DISMA|nr:hypothetical protein F7725_027098 [Dissostichus mawsoni]